MRPTTPTRSPYRGRQNTRPRPGQRLARPGRPPRRRSGNSAAPFVLVGVVALLVLLGAATWWRSLRSAGGDESGREMALAATSAALADPTATATAEPAPSRVVVPVGAVPGGEVALPPTMNAAELPAATPAVSQVDEAPTGLPATLTRIPDATGQVRPALTVAPASLPQGGEFDLPALRARMLELVNADRVTNGLAAVAWDDTAAAAGQGHAEDMAALGYMSHWNPDGYGPDHRYSQAGGLDISQENVYRLIYRWEDGTGAPISDWDEILRSAQAALMQSAGHRANILAPEHTHLGVGIGYQASTGIVSIAQEFVNHYVEIDPLPRRAGPGDRIVLRGRLLPDAASPLVNVAYEPLPTPLTLDELNNTGTYTPAAQPIDVPRVQLSEDGTFAAEYVLAEDAPRGLYHILVWVNTPDSSERLPAVDVVIESR